ncbi:hypothetical protein [Candidatus Magnetaquicoccus inordinatus]|uniref:hypothetical protein n=1 Tax=Candidatus Magnetaquicoccus inordinatus TaxID=2496818 RepID=UPI00102CA58E|nr:hypothetical protein [Candidatus Magnetaquicoccus inordinatus]
MMAGKSLFSSLLSLFNEKEPLAAKEGAVQEKKRVGVADLVCARQERIGQAEEEQDWQGAARTAVELSNVWLLMGEWQAVAALVARAQEWLHHFEDPLTRIYLHSCLAVARHRAGELQESRRLFQEAESWQAERQTAYHWLIGLPGSSYCALLLEQAREEGDWERVLHRSQYSQKIVKNQFAVAMDYLAQGRALAGLARHEAARVAMQQAVTLLRRSERRLYLPEFLLQQGHFLRQLGEGERAQSLWQEAWQIANDEALPPYQVECHLLAGHLAVDAKECDEAERALLAAEQGVQTLHYGQKLAEVHLLRLRLCRCQGRVQEAAEERPILLEHIAAREQWGLMRLWESELR